jgi:DNA-binding NtrC family response regulator
MMTAFASTDTALKSIRLGALDYIPKPFTPKELRSTVDNAISGKLVEAAAPVKERDLIDVSILMPFEAKKSSNRSVRITPRCWSVPTCRWWR